jgi:hypothetical protein
MIEMHPGNYYTQIRGCQLPGDGYADINKDGLYDVTRSRDTMHDILALVDYEFEIEIL